MTAATTPWAEPNEVLHHWGLEAATSRPLGRGLINATFEVTAEGERFVLQRLNPLFDPAIHHNFSAVSRHLARAGLATARLVETRGRTLWVEQQGCWRLQTAVPGVSFDTLASAAQARAAGAFVGRWHAALRDLEHDFVGLRAAVHDTPRHLARLREALDGHAGHRLYDRVAPLGAAILDGAARLAPMPAARARVGHGDLKLNNMMFAGSSGAAALTPVALVDLDSLAPLSLGYELGDAWRSWCNLAGEDEAEARFDLESFGASVEGWSAGWAAAGGNDQPLSAEEREGMLAGLEWISLELSARFAADALFEDYFGWDPARFPSRGDHNLRRAKGQWSLHAAVLASRSARAAVLGC